MNELLKQLMLEAGYAAPELAERANKLAELIVQECIDVSTKRSLHYEDHGDTEKSGAAGSVGRLIAEHFGVE